MREMSNAANGRILVVDSDSELTSELQAGLTRYSFQVDVAHNAIQGLSCLYALQPDLVLLDVFAPGKDGWDMLRRIREASDVPIMVMSVLDDEMTVSRGLDLGADDYLTKPFKQQELLARIQAVLRRTRVHPSQGRGLLHFGGGELVIDPSSYRVKVRGEDVKLTATEYRLLLHLARNAGYVLTYDQLLDRVWGPGRTPRLTTLRMAIGRLRRKIEVDHTEPRYVCNQRDYGYYLARD
jgi:two-component system KDP operon response regulator KdpE